MNEVISNQLFSLVFYVVVFFIICIFFMNKIPKLSKIAMQGIISSCFIFIINCVVYKMELCLGINFITVIAATFLGMPAISFMYLILYIL